MSARLHDWAGGLRHLREEWIALIHGAPCNPSLHPDWLDITVRSRELAGVAAVAEIRDASGALTVIPFLMRRTTVAGVPLRCLDLCSNLVSYHAQIPSAGHLAEALQVFIRLPQLPRWDVLRLGNLVSDGLTARALQTLQESCPGVFRYPGERSPFFPISTSWKDYLGGRPKKLRANITRSIRLMREAGESAMVWYETGADAAPLLRDMLQVESRSWKAHEEVAVTGASAEGRYYGELLPWLAANGVLANVLYVKEVPVAYVLCASWHGWIGQLKTSFSQELRDAGSRVIQASIERAFELGATEYDFLGDAAPHKLRWADQVRCHEDVWVFAPRWRGRILAQLKSFSDRLREARRKRVIAPVAAEES